MLLYQSLVIMLVLFLMGVTGSLAPRKYSMQQRTLSLANAFAGGVFFGAGFLHLLPDANKYLQAYQVQTGYPVANAVAVAGFIMMLFIERVIFPSHEHETGEDIALREWKSIEGNPMSAHTLRTTSRNECYFRDRHKKNEFELIPGIDECDITNPIVDEEEPLTPVTTEVATPSTHLIPSNHVHGHSHVPIGDKPMDIASFILLISLSVHSVIVGLALGLQTVDGSTVAEVIAIAIHKLTAASSLGIAFIHGNVSLNRHILFGTIFSLMTPAGVFLSLFLGSVNVLTTGILTSLAAGTFVYVSTLIVISSEFGSRDEFQITSKFFLFTIGAIVMAVIAKWA